MGRISQYSVRYDLLVLPSENGPWLSIDSLDEALDLLSQRRRHGRQWEPRKVSEFPQWKRYRRLQALLRDAEEIREAGRLCTAPLEGISSIKVPRLLLSRYKEVDPRPPWARAVLSKSPLAARVFALHLLIAYGLGEEPDAVDTRTVRRWLRDPRVDGRSLRRIRSQVNQIILTWKVEASAARNADGWASAEDAWRNPRPRYQPGTVDIPTGVWRDGWHLVLTKGELGWLLAFRAVYPSEARNAMREPLFGFTDHVVGLEIVTSCYQRGLQYGLDAPSALARELLWEPSILPRFELLSDEAPLAAFTARLPADQRDLFTVVTSRRLVARRCKVGLFWEDRDCVDIPHEAIHSLHVSPAGSGDPSEADVVVRTSGKDMVLVGVPAAQIRDGNRGWLSAKMHSRS